MPWLPAARFCVLAALSATRTLAATSKRGIAYIPYGYSADYNLLLSNNSELSWYYTWYPTSAPTDGFYGTHADTIEFVPTLKSLHNLTEPVLAGLPNITTSRYLFTFNEPDGEVDTGGTAISPANAARAYIDSIVPFRTSGRFQLSHPAVTGSERGFQWLRDFRNACFAIDAKNGCPADFVVVHWYGDFQGMADWMGRLAAWYAGNTTDGDVGYRGGGVGRPVRLWVTEMGLPQGNNETQLAVMAQTLPYLDGLEYVERYAWFGIFRPDNANAWTGSGLSLFRNDGGLSDLGALYLGGNSSGFTAGAKGLSYEAYNETVKNTTTTGGGSGGGQGGGSNEGGLGDANDNGAAALIAAFFPSMYISSLTAIMLCAICL